MHFLETEIDKDRLNNAINSASLNEFVKEKKAQDILIEENVKNLSGGRKQRVCIATALYHKSQLIVFDEVTSALDNETEAEVNETIKKLKGTGITIIIIVHRYTTLVNTDRIIELNNSGDILESTYNKII